MPADDGDISTKSSAYIVWLSKCPFRLHPTLQSYSYSLNLSITSYMLFRNRPPDVDFDVFIEYERINRVHVTKFLGIYIDDKLNWKYHINTVRSKLSKVAAIIYRASCLINQDEIYMLYCLTLTIVEKYWETRMLQMWNV